MRFAAMRSTLQPRRRSVGRLIRSTLQVVVRPRQLGVDGDLTRADLVRAFIRTDEQIAKEVREEFVSGTLWVDDSAVEIDVHDGEVVISGRGTVRFDDDLMRRVVARVPGVVSVTTHVALR
jgi:osmotically-inducible protein OsmY